MKKEITVGLFVLVALVVIGFMTLKVGGGSAFSGGKTYYVTVNTALGISDKTPVLISGFQAGVVDKISLQDSRHARLRLSVAKGVALTEGTQAAIRAKGVLGETFVELMPGPDENPQLQDDAELPFNAVGGDINQLVMKLNDMAPAASRSVDNLDKFTEVLKDLMLRNEQNVNRILANFAVLSEDLRATIGGARPGVQEASERIASITRKVDEGHGTIGKLLNDETTVNKMNEAVDNFNGLTGGLHRMQTEIGYHAEILGASKDVKNYASLALRPRPDQAFLLDFVTNPSPPPDVKINNSTVTVGGTSTNVNTTSLVTNRNSFRVSAQLAKKFYDWRLRGGIIENRGGVGMDYMPAQPVSASVDVWDFGSNDGRKPSVKLYGNLNMTRSLYLMGGGNDIANKGNRNWFVGAGVRVLDDDIKGVLGLGAGVLSK